MGEFLVIDDFEPHVGKVFRFKGTRYAMPLHRIQTNPGEGVPSGMKRKPFILIFRAPKTPEHLPDRMLSHSVATEPLSLSLRKRKARGSGLF
jgi:hypothetical protein